MTYETKAACLLSSALTKVNDAATNTIVSVALHPGYTGQRFEVEDGGSKDWIQTSQVQHRLIQC